MTDQPATVTCPVCDAPNAGRSLFCAECGAALNESNDPTPPVGTDANSDSQSTAVIPSSRSWADATSSSHDTTGQTSAATSISAPVQPLTMEPVDDSNPYLLPVPVEPESRRGFWLGVAALVLILIVLGLWIWGGILAADSRESIRNLFGMS